MRSVLLIAALTLASIAAANPQRIYFKDLRQYAMGSKSVPASVKAMDGKTISIIGFMVPFDSVDKIDRFVLLQAPFMGCYHVPPPQPNESILVNASRVKPTLTYDPVMVSGTLKVEPSYVEGYLVALYTLHLTSIRPAKQSDAELDGLPANFHMFSEF
jgi:hypothetical protein